MQPPSPPPATGPIATGPRVLAGCLKPLPITSLKDYALTSAFRDSRFSPMQERELPLLNCTVSLLTGFEQARHLADWDIGTHGVMIDYTDEHSQPRTAVYLPEVMPEQGWTKAETIDSLIRKSGYNQASAPSLRPCRTAHPRARARSDRCLL